MHLVMDREVSVSNPAGPNVFSTRLSFESNSSDFSLFVFVALFVTYSKVSRGP